jgi:hypothetical protein
MLDDDEGEERGESRDGWGREREHASTSQLGQSNGSGRSEHALLVDRRGRGLLGLG